MNTIQNDERSWRQHIHRVEFTNRIPHVCVCNVANSTIDPGKMTKTKTCKQQNAAVSEFSRIQRNKKREKRNTFKLVM